MVWSKHTILDKGSDFGEGRIQEIDQDEIVYSILELRNRWPVVVDQVRSQDNPRCGDD